MEGQLNEKTIAKRVEGYESWVDTVLRPVLEGYRTKKSKLGEEIGHYNDLKSKLAEVMSKEDGGPMETMAELGADCFIKAVVADPRRVYVHVALGFHVEFTLTEAMAFADKKKDSLGKALDRLGRQEIEVETDLQAATDMIDQLREFASSPSPVR